MQPTPNLSDTLTKLDHKEFSAVELTSEYLKRIRAHNPTLNALVTVCEDRALDQAAQSDARRARGEAGLLDGIPIVHKDLFCTQGIRTTKIT